MYELLWGFARVKPKWFKLFKEVKHGEIGHKLSLVQVATKRVNMTDGRQLLSLSRKLDWELKPDLYILTSDRFLIPAADVGEIDYPNFKELLKYRDRTKTATIGLGKNKPLSAMACAIQEFQCPVSLDIYSETLAAIDDLEPDYARVYGYGDPDKSKESNLIIEFLAEGVEALFVMLPDKEVERLLEVDEMPLFSNSKKSEE
jgi:hypothetical protein